MGRWQRRSTSHQFLLHQVDGYGSACCIFTDLTGFAVWESLNYARCSYCRLDCFHLHAACYERKCHGRWMSRTSKSIVPSSSEDSND